VLLIQHKAPLRARPFVLLWGLLLVPTFFAWCAFVTALYSIVARTLRELRARAGAARARRLSPVARQDELGRNWDLWSVPRWSDMGPLELDARRCSSIDWRTSRSASR
jgi:hypothetical protein